jgi:hypothetical protein
MLPTGVAKKVEPIVHQDGTMTLVPVEESEAPEPGAPIPMNTESRRFGQMPEHAAKIVNVHDHPDIGYNIQNRSPVSFPDFVASTTKDNVIVPQVIREDLSECCPTAGYYLGQPINPFSKEILPSIDLPGRLAWGTGGEPGLVIDRAIPYLGEGPQVLPASPRGGYPLESLSLQGRRLLPGAPGTVQPVTFNIIPGLALDFSTSNLRNMQLMDNIMQLPVDLRRRTVMGLTNIDPSQPGQIGNLLNVLAYAEHIDPRRTLKIMGNGEINTYKEAVMTQLDASHRFNWARSGPLHEYLQFVNDNMPGYVALIHNDAGLPLEFGLKGGAVGVLFHGPTEYTNVEPFIDMVNRFPNVNFVWAHAGGLSRSGYPSLDHTAILADAFSKVKNKNLYIDMSWDVVAQKVVRPEQLPLWAGPRGTGIMNRYADRFLFGTDSVAPTSMEAYLRTLAVYEEAGLLQNLQQRDMFLRNNALGILERASESVMNYRTQNSLRLLNRPLPAPWVYGVEALDKDR